MATEYLVEIVSWDQALHLFPSPGGIPEEHTFQGQLIFGRHLEIEGRLLSPPRHHGKRLRVWLSSLGPAGAGADPIKDVGNVEERVSRDLGRELVANLYAPEHALAPAAICLGSAWRYLTFTTMGRSPGGARVIEFSFSRSASFGDPPAAT